jgi:hypothetical protein
MYEDTMNDMDDDGEGTDVPTDDSGVLTDEEVAVYAALNPLIVYEDVRVKVGVLKSVREGYIRPLTIQMQGVRDGELTYKAGGTLSDRPLVPVFCLMEAELVDKMLVSPANLALGKAAIDSLNPAPITREFVDMVVEDYVEADPINREFFLPTEGGDDDDTLPITGSTPDRPTVDEVMGALGTTETLVGLTDDIDPGQPLTYGDPTSNPNFTGTITFGGYVQEPAMNTQELGTVEQVVAEPALIEDGGGVHVSDNLDAAAYQSPEALSVHPDRSPNNDLVDAAVEPMVVPGQGATAYSIDPMGLPVIETTPALEPGVLEDGTRVPYDPRLHELPIDQLPM